jgi:hypothetical protein
MGGVADDGLIEVAYLDRDPPLGVGDGPEIPNMAISADPNGWPFGHLAGAGIKPFIEFDGAPANICMSRASHLEVARAVQRLRPIIRPGHGERRIVKASKTPSE